jgi:DNA-binding SARP family transcriptional activator
MVLFRILGPVCICGTGQAERSFTSVRVRALYAALLLNANVGVPTDQLAEYVWPDPPPSAGPNLRNHASVLRRMLEATHAGLGTRLHNRRGECGSGAYWLVVNDDELDSDSFLRLARKGELALRAGNPHGAAAALSEALRLWRGPAGADLPDTAPLREVLEPLHRRRTAARLTLCQARLDLGDPTAVIDELFSLVHQMPYAEWPVALLMRALCATGEQHAALAEYYGYRERLDHETGSEPSQRLRVLHLSILRNETEPSPPTPRLADSPS